jgi:hypothetical protein
MRFIPTVAITLLLVASAHAQVWTAPAGSCPVDENAQANYDVTHGALRFRANRTGVVQVRCNITNPVDDNGDPGWNRLELSYIDPSGSDTNTVYAVLRRQPNGSATSVALATANSASLGSSRNVLTRGVNFSHTFDFLTNSYYVEIGSTRGDVNAETMAINVRLLRR